MARRHHPEWLVGRQRPEPAESSREAAPFLLRSLFRFPSPAARDEGRVPQAAAQRRSAGAGDEESSPSPKRTRQQPLGKQQEDGREDQRAPELGAPARAA